MKKLLIAIALFAALAGAAVATGLADPLIRWQVKGALVDAGVGEKRTQCMAGRMVKRLSIAQLWNLRQAMAPREGEPEDGYGLGELVKRLRRVGDGETVAVLTTSAGLCAIGLG